MITPVDLALNLKQFEDTLSATGAIEFESFWASLCKKPGMEKIGALRSVFETVFIGAFVDGGEAALAAMCEAMQRQRSTETQ